MQLEGVCKILCMGKHNLLFAGLLVVMLVLSANYTICSASTANEYAYNPSPLSTMGL